MPQDNAHPQWHTDITTIYLNGQATGGGAHIRRKQPRIITVRFALLSAVEVSRQLHTA